MTIPSQLKDPKVIASIVVVVIAIFLVFHSQNTVTTIEKQYSAQVSTLDSAHAKDSAYVSAAKYQIDSLTRQIQVMSDSVSKSSATIKGKTVITTHTKTVNKDGSSTESDQTEVIDTGKILNNYVQVIKDSLAKISERKVDSSKSVSVTVHDTMYVTKHDSIVSYKESTKIVTPAEKKLTIAAGIEGGYAFGSGFSDDFTVNATYAFKTPFYVEAGIEKDGITGGYADPKQYVFKTGAGIQFSF